MLNKKSGKLLDDVKQVMRINHYSIHTERIYVDWINQYVKYHKMDDRWALLANPETKIEEFLSYLAVQRKVAASTQNQAMNALVFLFKRVLETPLEKTVNATRSTKNRKKPAVLSQNEVKETITLLEGNPQLVVKLLYGSGLRISEAVRLRVQDIDFENKQITIRSGNDNRDRVTTFSTTLMPQIKNHLQRVKLIHDKDLLNGYGSVYLPNSLCKQHMNAEKEWSWQYVFPARNNSFDPLSGKYQRHHVDQSVINKAIKVAVKKLGLTKKVSALTFRHSFATHLLQRGTDIRTVHALLGHNDLKTTKIYTLLLNQDGQHVTSPLDELGL